MTDHPEDPRLFSPGEQFRQFHYVVQGFLGEGASGQVYAVRHRFTDERFALKVNHLEDRGNARRVARSLVEARASHCIQHDNVVRVFDLGCEEDGLVWQLMELLEGQTVGALLRRMGRLSPVYAIDVLVEAAYGLQAAHELGIVHRDVQPSNVFVTSAGRVKVLDFSLSSWIRSPLKTTHGRGPRGSLGYMAPEHLLKAVPTPAFDVYALGIMLWELLVGRHPFEESLGNAARLVLRQLKDAPESLVTAAGLPAYVDEIVQGAVAKDPAARYAGMWPFAQALIGLRERLLADTHVEARVRHGEAWERRLPIVRATESALRYESSLAPAAGAVLPHPSARVYVPRPVAAGPVPAEPSVREARVAATVPMEAVLAPAGEASVNRTPMAVAAPLTVRRRAAPWPVRWIGAAVGVPVLLGLGVGVWVLSGSTAAGPGASPSPVPPPPSTGAPAAPRASAPAASASSSELSRPFAPSADPRRRPPPRPRR